VAMTDTYPAPKRLAHIPAFDGFRGIGVMIVIFSHFPQVSDSGLYNLAWMINQVSRVGYVALDVFFVISGFFITRLLLLERETTGEISFANFYWRRALRIFPIYYLTIFVCYFLFHFGADDTLSLLTYTFNIYHPFHSAPHPLEHTWSLSVEEQFYFIWPLLILLVPMRLAGFVTGRVVPLMAVFCGFMIGVWLGARDNAIQGDIVYMSLFTRMLSLSLGGWLAVREFEGRPLRGRPCLVMVALSVVGLALDRMGRDLGIISSQGAYWTIALMCYSLFSVAFASTIIFDRRAPGRWMRAFLSIAPFRWLGRISYAIYLYHLPVLFALGMNDGVLNGGKVTVVKAGLAMFVIVGFAIVSFFLIERPAANLRNVIKRRSVVPERIDPINPGLARWRFPEVRDYH
jgi:peptidoglycan/LPS O-acetylase OafA/YrhL